MKKIAVIVALCIAVLLLITNTGVFAQSVKQLSAILTSIKVYHNDTRIDFDSPVVLIDGKTYVPLRELGEFLGMDVEWNGSEQKVNLTEGGKDDKSNLMSMIIYPYSAAGPAYRIELFKTGKLAASVGRTSTTENVTDLSYAPKIIKQRQLTDSEMSELRNIISQISIIEPEKADDDLPPDRIAPLDGWCLNFFYQGEIRQYIYWGISNEDHIDTSDPIKHVIGKLVLLSPIKIIAFAYDDAYKADYYNNKENW